MPSAHRRRRARGLSRRRRRRCAWSPRSATVANTYRVVGFPNYVIRLRAMDSAIKLRGFVKRFGGITAVDGLDLDVPYGTCVGLLGPNGAGKSTTMKALPAQVVADEGDIEVVGYQLPEDSKQARALIGVVPQLDNLD